MKNTALNVLRKRSFAAKKEERARLMAAAITICFAILLLVLPQGKQAASGQNASNSGSESLAPDLWADFDWEMPERFGLDGVESTDELKNFRTPPEGWVDPVWYEDRWHTLSPRKSFIHRDNWEVKLTASSTVDVPIKSYRWEVWGDPEPKFGWEIRVSFKAMGTYPVRVTVTAEDGRVASVAKNVVVKDLLIVSLGDSAASGEGNPDRDGSSLASGNTIVFPPTWANKQCHRSLYSGPAQSALAIEKADRHSSVTFISLACSGAEIKHLIEERYKGIEPSDEDPLLEPQILALKELVCPDGRNCSSPEGLKDQRPIDALIISAGINDLHFSEFAIELVYNGVPQPIGQGGDYDPYTCSYLFTKKYGGYLAALPQSLDNLKRAIDEHLNTSQVYFTEYPDPTHKANGIDFAKMQFGTCFSRPGSSGPTDCVEPDSAVITSEESQCAYQNLLQPLNYTIQQKVLGEFKWNYIDGIMELFKKHGYGVDNDNGNTRWFVRCVESWKRQWNDKGALHPNKVGHKAIADRLFTEIWSHESPSPTLEGFITDINCERITGWAWDKGLPVASTQDGDEKDVQLYVSLYDGDQLLATVQTYNPNQGRSAGHAQDDHVFSIPIPDSLKDGSPHSISVKIAGIGMSLGSGIQLTCAPLSYQGSLDPATCEKITGYASDRNNPGAILSVDIYDGDELLGTAMANQMRTPPLPINPITGGASAAFTGGPTNSPNSHGFVFPIPDHLKDGKPHSISVRFKDTATSLSNSPRSLSCVASSYQGLLDPVSCSAISGYAWNKDQPGAFLNVDIYDGEKWLARVTANQVRQTPFPFDAGSNNQTPVVNPPVNNHGFTYVVPDSLKDGKPHVISVKFSGTPTTTGPNPGTSVHLSHSPQTLICVPPSYAGALTSAGCGGIAGYAYDKSRLQEILKVDIYDGNKLLATVAANQASQGSDPLGGIGSGGRPSNHSFSYPLPDGLKDGKTHTISAKYAGTPINLSGSPKQLTVPPVVITQQPVSVVACLGKPATFSVTAVGSGLSYQWRKNGGNIPGETRSTLTIGSVTAGDVASYSVVVSSACGLPVTSGAATLTVSTSGPIKITNHPQSTGACVGQAVSFSVAATGANLLYQWRKDGGNLPGETGSSLTIRSLKLGDAGTYSVVVYNGCESVVSGNAVLTINNPIAITKQPASATICVGQPVTFSVTATGTNLRYKWRKNGGNIPGAGAEGSSFTIPAASAADAASYSVVVYNGCSTIESARATLAVNTTNNLTLSAPGQSFNASGGSGSVGVTGCGAWTAASNASWITITSPTSGIGNGTVTYSVAANSTYYLRSGALTIGGKTFNLSQQPAQMANDSRFIIQNAPVTMVAGGRYNVSVTFRNMGSSTWTAANGYKLVSQAPLNNTTWGMNEVPFPSSVASVAPGADVTFSFTVTAPATPGRYRFDWRVTQGTAGFGSFTPGLEISVTQ
jgi:hypothetical protein